MKLDEAITAFLRGADALRIVLFILVMVFYTWAWFRQGCLLPRYVHAFAGLAFIAAAAVAMVVYSGDRSTAGGLLLIVALCPTIVYAAFVVFGGAYKRPQRPDDDN
jgi:hypothetical protein